MGEYFANDISDKWLISKIVNELMQFNVKISWLKMSRGTEQTFFWRRNTVSQLIHENMFSIIKTSEITSHLSEYLLSKSNK